MILLLLSASALAQPHLVVQTGHTDMITAVAFSPDGSRVLTGAYDQTARVWDTATGRELLLLADHDEFVTSAAWSPDGRFIATGTRTARLHVFSADTGGLVYKTPVSGWQIYALAWSPDGSRLVTGDHDKSVTVWTAANGHPERRFPVAGMVNAVAVSPDGQSVLVGTMEGAVSLYSLGTGQPIVSFSGHAARVNSVAFAPDGTTVLTGSEDGTTRLWETATGRLLYRLPPEAPSPPVISGSGRPVPPPPLRKVVVGAVAFSRDGRLFAAGGADGAINIWSTDDGTLVRTLAGPPDHINAIAFSPDDLRILSAGHGKIGRLWSLETGEVVMSFEGRVDAMQSVDVRPDGRTIAGGSGSRDHRVSLWSLSGGSLAMQLPAAQGNIESLRYSPDGRVLAGAAGAEVGAWDGQSGDRLQADYQFAHAAKGLAFAPDSARLLAGSFDRTATIIPFTGGPVRACCTDPGSIRPEAIMSVAWSPDGRYLATGERTDDYDRNHAYLWDASSNALVRVFGPVGSQVSSVEFSPDGTLLLGSSHGAAYIWDVATGRVVHTLDHQGAFLTSAVWTPDGQRVVTGGRDRLIRIWDASSGAELKRLTGHSGQVNSVRVFNGGAFVASASQDGTIRLWDAERGIEICKLVSFGDGGWAVVDPAGRFDASNGGEVEGLHWVVDGEALALSQLKDRFYEPGLLAKLLGFNDEPTRDVTALAQARVALHPKVTITHAPDRNDPVLRMTVENRGGGIGPVQVLVNGKEAAADIRPPGSDPGTGSMQLALDLAGNPLFVAGADNRIDVVASNGNQTLKSRGVSISVLPNTAPTAGSAVPPSVWAVVIGVSEYRGDDIDLAFAHKDAESFAAALEIAASRLVSPDRVHIRTLGGPGAPATRESIRQAFDEIRGQATSSDILVLYMAGHGVTWGGGHDADYYYLLSDAASLDVSDAAVRQRDAISSQELTDLIKGVAALKQVLILDTCASGQIVTDLAKSRGVPSSQMRSLERMKDRTGMFVLAGSAADAVSYEASPYGQGLLTYSLLTGMRGPALRDQEYVDVNQLFSFASDEVQRLVHSLGGVQQPRIGVPHGGSSFDIGRVTSDDRARIQVAAPKPIVMQTDFRGPRRRDDLKLEVHVDAALRDAAAKDNADFVFFDTDDFPDAILITGDYVITGDQVTVTATVFAGEAERGSFEVEGLTGDLDSLATRVVDSAGRLMR